ncbi:TIR domain-containing protein [Gottfriedia sp. NPDC058432]|uniref:TIR domain-containing protein n=1 Tax=Gottfriedia sp. NPDC058432 TaxID=3346497 RepID=UPI00364AF34A
MEIKNNAQLTITNEEATGKIQTQLNELKHIAGSFVRIELHPDIYRLRNITNKLNGWENRTYKLLKEIFDDESVAREFIKAIPKQREKASNINLIFTREAVVQTFNEVTEYLNRLLERLAYFPVSIPGHNNEAKEIDNIHKLGISMVGIDRGKSTSLKISTNEAKDKILAQKSKLQNFKLHIITREAFKQVTEGLKKWRKHTYEVLLYMFDDEKIVKEFMRVEPKNSSMIIASTYFEYEISWHNEELDLLNAYLDKLHKQLDDYPVSSNDIAKQFLDENHFIESNSIRTVSPSREPIKSDNKRDTSHKVDNVRGTEIMGIERNKRTALIIQKLEAKDRILTQIEKLEPFKHKLDSTVVSDLDLKIIKAGLEKWKKLTYDVLLYMFDNDIIAEEFNQLYPEYNYNFGDPLDAIYALKGELEHVREYLEYLLERVNIYPVSTNYNNATNDINQNLPNSLAHKVVSTLEHPNPEPFSRVLKPLKKVSSKVFIVHGHDNEVKQTVARFVEKQGLEAIILNEQGSGSRTVIEKIEEYSDVKFAIVLFTPDDVGFKKGDMEGAKPRARQNVMLELGYFLGKLGRNKVVVLRKDDVEIPSDFSGVLYIPLDSEGAWRYKAGKEMKLAGLDIDMNKI